MNFKTALMSIFVALLALTCTAGASDITYDLSGIPDSPTAGTQYIIPVTITGDVPGYKLNVLYDAGSAEIDFNETDSATIGGRPGQKKVVSADGTPKTFNLLIKPLSNSTITLNSELAGDIPCSIHDEIKFVFSGSAPTPTVKPTVEPSPTVKPTAEPTPTVEPDASGITYDFSSIPDFPVAGTQYIVPVTVTGDVTGYNLNVVYDVGSAEVYFSDTDSATTGGRPGKIKIVSADGTPKKFNLIITPLSNSTITLNSELAGNIPCSTHDEIKFVFSGSVPTPTVNPTVDPASGSVNLLPTGGKIDWYTENIRVINGKAYIQVVMTGADRVAGITVNLKNVSGANVALNRTGSALFKSGSSTKLNYYSANGFTNSDTVSLYTIDITNISEGVPVSFDLEYGVIDTGKRDVTLDYTESNPVSVSFTAGEAEEPTVEPTEESPETFTVTYSGSDYVPDAVIVEAGAEYIISDDRAVSPGRIFRGWTAGSEEYAAGDKMIVTGNVTLTAEWYTPAINPTGANVVDLYKILHGEDPDQHRDYDMNGDGHVTIIDLVLMAQYVADNVAVTPEDKITWDTSSVVFDNGRASIPVIITDAYRIQGMRVSVNNVSNANVTLNCTGSPIFTESGPVIIYFTPAAGYTNEDAAQLFSIDITDAAAGSDVMFTLNFDVTSNAKNVTSSYVMTPAAVMITVREMN